uniref:Uncharacterized protein n=1 Tax=Sarcophilus harrisii TaxID=9305 RepID=A0A7N4UX82_SARHA
QVVASPVTSLRRAIGHIVVPRTGRARRCREQGREEKPGARGRPTSGPQPPCSPGAEGRGAGLGAAGSRGEAAQRPPSSAALSPPPVGLPALRAPPAGSGRSIPGSRLGLPSPPPLLVSLPPSPAPSPPGPGSASERRPRSAPPARALLFPRPRRTEAAAAVLAPGREELQQRQLGGERWELAGSAGSWRRPRQQRESERASGRQPASDGGSSAAASPRGLQEPSSGPPRTRLPAPPRPGSPNPGAAQEQMRKGGESPPKSWTEEQASQEGPPFPVIMKKSRSVMTVTADENVKDYLECGLSKSYSSSSNTLGIDLWRGRRCCSGNLQLPPLSQRQSERARTPDGDSISRPTTLPLLTLPSIAITTVSQESPSGYLKDFRRRETLTNPKPIHFLSGHNHNLRFRFLKTSTRIIFKLHHLSFCGIKCTS